MLRTRLRWSLLVIPLLFAAVMVGCNRAPAPTAAAPAAAEPASATAAPKADEEVHGHKPGAHGGTMVTIGAENYHAEVVFEKGGLMRLYMLGSDESKVIDVETQTLTGYARAEGDTESTSFTLEPDPQPGDAADKTSVFKATLPKGMAGKSLTITIPSMRIAGERFRLGFTSAPAESHQEEMPDKVSDDAERKLYLTPGGLYTQADIAANGNKTASEKFAGLKAAHDLNPKAGDKICPITQTKANSQFTWVVGGKPYEFCCPPCVDEFVQLAKDKPDEIKQPDDYRKQ